MKKSLIYFAILFGGLIFAGSNINAQKAEKAMTVAEAQAVQYTCPMHPDVVMNEPGKCPKCGMTLVKKNNTKQDMNMHQMHGNQQAVANGMMKDHPCKMKNCDMMGDSASMHHGNQGMMMQGMHSGHSGMQHNGMMKNCNMMKDSTIHNEMKHNKMMD